VDERDDVQSLRDCIIKLLLGVADAICANRTVPTREDEKVIVTVINDALYEFELLFICRGKHFHPGWNAIHLNDCLNYCSPLIFQVVVSGTNEDLVALIHSRIMPTWDAGFQRRNQDSGDGTKGF
jgi:hypothetical protein